MRQYALLRAINVGKHNRIRMDALRALCEPLGLGQVTTYLQTGNLTFESDEDPETVALRMEEALLAAGLKNAAVVVRTSDEMRELLAAPGFEEYDPERYRHWVTLFRSPLTKEQAARASGAPGVVAVRPREVFTVSEKGQPAPGDGTKAVGTTRYMQVLQAFFELGEAGPA